MAKYKSSSEPETTGINTTEAKTNFTGTRQESGTTEKTESSSEVKITLKPKVTRDREATEQELECIEKTEEMLREENQLPPASQMIRNIATDHWRSLKSWLKGSQVIASQDEAERRWNICLKCPNLKYDETNPDTNKKMVDALIVDAL